ncbi:3'-5' exonuclease [Schwartzia sp. (in: firmicutes)]
MEEQTALTPEEQKAKEIELEKKARREKRKRQRSEFRKGILAKVNHREICLETPSCGKLPSDYITAFDLEGAGFSEDDIIEIGAVKINLKTGETSDFQEMMSPRTRLNKYVTQITGITKEELVGKRKLQEVLPEFLRFVGDSIVLGHSIGNNDMVQINLAIHRFRMKEKFYPYFIDTERMAHRLLDDADPPVIKFGLEPLLQKYGVVLTENHRALADAYASYQLLQVFMKNVGREGILPGIS